MVVSNAVLVKHGSCSFIFKPLSEQCSDFDTNNKMSARAILTSRPNSHPFQERRLVLDQKVKVGRSVARARPATNNVIFDCKVLSRNHALFWYENGKFYLQDTKSSNGTFVNNQRLSKSLEESAPQEVCSGDIVQFGVDVMENSRKVTHGCIVATLKLYLPDGKEAKASRSTTLVGAVQLDELYQLNSYLQEALQREKVLETKLHSLQQLVVNTQEASDMGWKALIDEDLLISRVEILENKLQAFYKNLGEDKLKNELCVLLEDKDRYQYMARQSIKKVIEEKLEAVHSLKTMERTLSTTEEECECLQILCEQSQNDLKDLAQKYKKQLVSVEELTAKLQAAEEKQQELQKQLDQEKTHLKSQLEEHLKAEKTLQAKLKALEDDRGTNEIEMSHICANIKSVMDSDSINNDNDDINLKEAKYDVQLLGVSDDDTLSVNSNDHFEQNNDSEAKYDVQLLNISDDDSLPVHSDDLFDQNNDSGGGGSQEKLDESFIDSKSLAELTPEGGDSEYSRKNGKEEGKQSKKASGMEESLPQDGFEEGVLSDDSNQLKQQLQVIQNRMKEKAKFILELQDKIHSASEVIGCLKESLQSEQQKSAKYYEEAENSKKLLLTAEQNVKQSRNEAEQLKDKIKSLQVELDTNKINQNSADDNKNSSEIMRLTSECALLHSKISELEMDIKRSRSEKCRLIDENNSLLKFKEEVNVLKGKLSSGQTTSFLAEYEECRSQLQDNIRKIAKIEEELVIVKERYSICNEEKTLLAHDLQSLKGKYKSIDWQSYVAVIISVTPFLVFLGFLVLIYPVLSYFTGSDS
ncbi:sarcolemmal membrane-associated protein [Ischnura elegans]|uniref:sarcolemmal membrane-associated protein n=1 Tax=Ischnura elegans TaxID=197161 RepID=UPI001ED89665|nr:sarcolemmal membrane-associated protein [Ischnura elegans]